MEIPHKRCKTTGPNFVLTEELKVVWFGSVPICGMQFVVQVPFLLLSAPVFAAPRPPLNGKRSTNTIDLKMTRTTSLIDLTRVHPQSFSKIFRPKNHMNAERAAKNRTARTSHQLSNITTGDFVCSPQNIACVSTNQPPLCLRSSSFCCCVLLRSRLSLFAVRTAGWISRNLLSISLHSRFSYRSFRNPRVLLSSSWTNSLTGVSVWRVFAQSRAGVSKFQYKRSYDRQVCCSSRSPVPAFLCHKREQCALSLSWRCSNACGD